METRGRLVAENMLRGGYDKRILWESSTVCRVPSQIEEGTEYRVDIAAGKCQCPASTQGGKIIEDNVENNLKYK